MNEENKTEEIFQCICGKQFKTGRALGSHKSQCKIYQESVKDQKLKEIQEKESRRLPNGMFKCENPDCVKEHDGSFGSGRFCCKSCYKSFIGYKSGESRRLNKFERKATRAPYGTWTCKFCGEIFETRKLMYEHIWSIHRKKYGPHGKGKIAWNKNLTKETDERIANAIKTLKANYASGKIIAKNKGKPLAKEIRERISETRSKQVESDQSGFPHVKWYKVQNLNGIEYTVRGHWEENVALQLNKFGILWEKNRTLKYFDGDITRTYVPDFYIPDRNLYVEVKGYFSDKDKQKMKFVLEQNSVKIYFIGSDKYFDFINGKIEFNDKLVYTII